MNEVELTVDRIAVGGKGLGLDGDGRVTFVEDVAPPERVRVKLTKQNKRFAEGRVVSVIEASADRVEPACPHAAGSPRCGGCDWQHISADGQRRLRVEMVEDALRRIGKLDTNSFSIRSGDPLPDSAYRTGVRMTVDSEGRLAYRQRGSHRPFAPRSCMVVHPLLDELIQNVRCEGADEVSIRVGAATGERMILIHGRGWPQGVPDDVVVARDPGAGFIHEEIDGARLRISAGAFFQSSPQGAAALVAAVETALDGVDRSGVLLDAYSGGGLFSATVGRGWFAAGGTVLGVESNPLAVADAKVNAAHATSVVSAVERWTPVPVDAVIADPARSGLEAAGVRTLAQTGAPVVVLVSCDVGALGRDAGLLASHGYEISDVVVLDLFNQTSHAEVVTRFVLNQAIG